MNAKALNRNTRAGTAAGLSLVIVTAILLMLAGGYAAAYDGDVDFSAPYLTVDPETGKLITVDPKAQPQQPQHQADGSGTAQNPTAPGGTGTADAMPAQTAPAAQTDVEAGTDSAAFLVYALGGLVVLIGVAAAVRAGRRRQTVPSGESGESV